MKINGLRPNGPNSQVIVFPRPLSKDIVFKVQAVLDMEEFTEILPRPTAPEIVYSDRSEGQDLKDPKYLEKMDEWAGLKTTFLVLKSLSATPDLEWEKVKMNDPTTWNLYKEELKESGFSEVEVGRLIHAVMDVNSLIESTLIKARETFLAGQQGTPKS